MYGYISFHVIPMFFSSSFTEIAGTTQVQSQLIKKQSDALRFTLFGRPGDFLVESVAWPSLDYLKLTEAFGANFGTNHLGSHKHEPKKMNKHRSNSLDLEELSR